MSNGISTLHSHSALERELKFPKHIVLVDECYGSMFFASKISQFRRGGKNYYKVPTKDFVDLGGVFRNLSA